MNGLSRGQAQYSLAKYSPSQDPRYLVIATGTDPGMRVLNLVLRVDLGRTYGRTSAFRIVVMRIPVHVEDKQL